MNFDQFDKDDAGPTPSSAHHAKAFPLYGQYLKTWLNPAALAKTKTFDSSDARTSTSRWETFVKYCGSEKAATLACTWSLDRWSKLIAKWLDMLMVATRALTPFLFMA